MLPDHYFVYDDAGNRVRLKSFDERAADRQRAANTKSQVAREAAELAPREQTPWQSSFADHAAKTLESARTPGEIAAAKRRLAIAKKVSKEQQAEAAEQSRLDALGNHPEVKTARECAASLSLASYPHASEQDIAYARAVARSNDLSPDVLATEFWGIIDRLAEAELNAARGKAAKQAEEREKANLDHSRTMVSISEREAEREKIKERLSE
ncbi:hypothetical protein [Bremerella sp. P1]|uniref:hypothetical protein n=1 Tax=Bremerella sp. P1 TaxID=3026424 RepID=UPI0023684A06|nr:hypothetical protein [Bremerella sp. P1]WDI40231.1 hypothetical protein PSR63_17260 [Bremerella sp. P1]